jgi:subtilisin family serine protease
MQKHILKSAKIIIMIKIQYKFIFIFLFSLFSILGYSQDNSTWNDKISPELLNKLEKATKVDFIVYLKNQYRVKDNENRLNKKEQAETAYSQLRNNNFNSQKDIVTLIDRLNYKYKRFLIINAVLVKGDINLVKILANRRDVSYIAYDSPVKQETGLDISTKTLNEFKTTWGIKMIEADKVWDLGYHGAGVVVGGQDTGYDWTHPAIKFKYRGFINDTLADHNYNWHDAIHEISPLHNDSIIDPSNNPCGLDIQIPCDDHSHGTHTMGTMVGRRESDSLIIGVAPEANWIGCRNMERGWGKPSTYIECFEWFMAPTDLQGQNPDPAKSPDVINNSWGCPVKEGCDSTNWQYMELALDNLRNSGVFIVVSAGNDGIKRCGSIQNPASIFKNSFVVGATRQIIDTTGMTFRDTIAGFSSRGPVIVDGSYRLKPDITAPGQGVLSCVPGNKYRLSSGTSMAGPHVAGVVALILSANPDLKGKVDRIAEIIEETADPRYNIDSCRGIDEAVLPNSVYGYGRINALKAVERALEIKTSTKEMQNDISGIVIYPNPTNDFINLKTDDNSNISSYSVYDQYGLLRIRKSELENNKINISVLNSGVYYLRLNINNKWIVKKLIKL